MTSDSDHPRPFQLSPDDIERVAELEASSFDRPWAPSALAPELESPHGLALGVTSSSSPELIAYCLLRVIHDEAELMRIAVRPACRRRGLAATLLRSAEGRLADRVTTLHLEVRSDNHPAIGLYERHGWVRSGRRATYYGPSLDALLFTKSPLARLSASEGGVILPDTS